MPPVQVATNCQKALSKNMTRPLQPWQLDIRAGRNVTFALGRTTIQHVYALEAAWAGRPCPIGVLWWYWDAPGVVAIAQSFVPEKCRRLGVRTRLHQVLIERLPAMRRIITESATVDGEAWLRFAGFRRGHDGGWSLNVQRGGLFGGDKTSTMPQDGWAVQDGLLARLPGESPRRRHANGGTGGKKRDPGANMAS